MMNFKLPFVMILLFMMATLPMIAQELTARQMNLYFGHPKRVTKTNSQGTMMTEFDRNGRVTCTRQGNISVTYEWNELGDAVTLSMYQGANFQEGVHVQVEENLPSRLKYSMGNALFFDVLFKDNGTLNKTVIVGNAPMSASFTFIYENESDIFPSQIEQRRGNQSMIIDVVVIETDSYGNAIVYTQECQGQKDVIRLNIEYY